MKIHAFGVGGVPQPVLNTLSVQEPSGDTHLPASAHSLGDQALAGSQTFFWQRGAGLSHSPTSLALLRR